MKPKKRMAAALVLLALVVSAQAFLPEVTADARRTLRNVLTLDRDAPAVWTFLRGREETPPPHPPVPVPSPAPVPARETAEPAPAARELRYRMEESLPLGEEGPVPEPELPAAVTAFLEQQGPFLEEHSLPENVDYRYTELPFDYALPVEGRNSSGFGYRMHPILEEIKFHYGTDIAAWSGEDIFAFADGTVTFSGLSDTYGNYIIIDHGGGWTSLYAHCSSLLVTGGKQVWKGEKIALVGATGRVTGPHLHFELRHDGVYVNPEYYINA